MNCQKCTTNGIWLRSIRIVGSINEVTGGLEGKMSRWGGGRTEVYGTEGEMAESGGQLVPSPGLSPPTTVPV